MIKWAVAFLCATASAAPAQVVLTLEEITQTLTFGPWPPVVKNDPSNRVSGDPRAIELGAVLFVDPLLSVDGTMACTSCHDPQKSFTTRDPRAIGRDILDRNTPTVQNLAGLRWYGWGGKSDNLWAASLHPIIASREMAHSPESLKREISNSVHKIRYEQIFGELSAQDPQTVLVNTAKTLAAYLETLTTARTAFDDFRDALAEGEMATASQFPLSAQRGLQIFLGRGNCVLCHNGPKFSNNEFHDAGVPYFLNETTVDPGRYAGLKAFLGSPYTLASDWNDDPAKTGAWRVHNVRRQHSDFGSFRTPSLRSVNATAPYMHDGSLEDLGAVVRHYSELDTERLHTDGEALLFRLDLSPQELSDLVAFLGTLGFDQR